MMKVKREEFLSVLSAVKPGLAKRDIIEQATHFIFTGKDVITYNDYICISHPLKTEFSCTVDADKLYKVLSGISAESVELGMEKNELRVSSKKTNSGLASYKEGKILEHIAGLGLQAKDKKWRKLPDKFVEGIFLCMFSASRDMTHGILTCIFVEGDKIIASDDLRISSYTLESEVKEKMFIPIHSALELVKFPLIEYCVTKVGETNSWIHFRTGDGVTFSTRTMMGKYPSVEKHFEIEGKKLTLPKELQGAVKYVSVMADGVIDIDRKVQVKIEKGEVKVTGSNSTGWISQQVETDYDGRDFTFHINPTFLQQVLDKSTKVIVGKQAAKFISGKFKHILVLSE
jgi:DNA polymerase III sliding clamp (beta) subunit (PCNA family)